MRGTSHNAEAAKLAPIDSAPRRREETAARVTQRSIDHISMPMPPSAVAAYRGVARRAILLQTEDVRGAREVCVVFDGL